MDKGSGCTKLLDLACVMDRHVVDKYREKCDKYLDLAIELQKLWNTRIEIVPHILGHWATVNQSTLNSFESLQLKDIKVCQLVKTVFFEQSSEDIVDSQV